MLERSERKMKLFWILYIVTSVAAGLHMCERARFYKRVSNRLYNLLENKCGLIEKATLTPCSTKGEHPESSSASTPPLHVNGIFPDLTATAQSGPVRSESGTGALMPWLDNLYMVSYLSVAGGGNGTGLYEISKEFKMRKLVDHQSTYANRLLHRETSQIIIGAWAIDLAGQLHTFTDLLTVRVGATAEHLTNPERMVYMLGMDGPLWECDVILYTCTQLFDLVVTLNISVDTGEQPHFKAAHTMNGRLVVASNTFEEADYLGERHGGRLAEWRGPGYDWNILARTAFVEVTGRRNFGRVIYAVGWDQRSAILKVFDGGDESAPSSFRFWQTYRLPKASHAYDHLWQTEWPRIREVETERYLADIHGQFYELSPLGWAGSTLGLRPVSQHLRMIPDFTSFRGFLVLGGNQVSSIFDNNVVTGQAQSGLWFGKTDDLWSFGKPQGWGAVWRRDVINQDGKNYTVASDPFLMTGFDKKVLHISLHEPIPLAATNFEIQVDFTGAAGHISGEQWYTITTVKFGYKEAYRYYIFPTGFSAHWVRLVASSEKGPCIVSAFFHYT